MDEQFSPANEASGVPEWRPDTWSADAVEPTEPTVVNPPVPASELPPLPEGDKPVSFWKKEISFGRREKTKPERPKKQKAARRPKKVKAAEKTDETSGKTAKPDAKKRERAERKAERKAARATAQAAKKAESDEKKAAKATARAAEKAERDEKKAAQAAAQAAKKAESADKKAAKAAAQAAKNAESADKKAAKATAQAAEKAERDEKKAAQAAAQAAKKAEREEKKAAQAAAQAAKKAESADKKAAKATAQAAKKGEREEKKAAKAAAQAAKKAEKATKREEKTAEKKAVKAPKPKNDRPASRTPKKLVGLKIGASQLAAAYVSNNGAAELVQVARAPLDPGIVVGGELRDPHALVQALKDFFRRNRLPRRGVRLGIANNRIGVRTFDVVGIDDAKQLANAIKYRAQEALPIPIDEAVLDYQILSEFVDDEGKRVWRVLLVVAYREQIDRYVEACKKAEISLAGIDLEAFALLRALQAPQEGAGDDPTAALVAVTLGHDRSTFAVSDGRICEFTRVLDWGGATLNVVLARVLEAAPSEVEGIKRSLSLANDSVPAGLTSEQAEKARSAIRNAIQSFARELVSSLQYYQNQPGSLGIGEIVLTGGTAHLPGLAAELERLIGVRVQVGDPLARMKVSKKVREPEQLGSFAVAIGLGIED
jgi:type IV pilus assembly protein PilM